eukprot:scaffold544_cov256-Pinguiococcus_pyrenoidosus.AAC.13
MPLGHTSSNQELQSAVYAIRRGRFNSVPRPLPLGTPQALPAHAAHIRQTRMIFTCKGRAKLESCAPPGRGVRGHPPQNRESRPGPVPEPWHPCAWLRYSPVLAPPPVASVHPHKSRCARSQRACEGRAPGPGRW